MTDVAEKKKKRESGRRSRPLSLYYHYLMGCHFDRREKSLTGKPPEHFGMVPEDFGMGSRGFWDGSRAFWDGSRAFWDGSRGFWEASRAF